MSFGIVTLLRIDAGAWHDVSLSSNTVHKLALRYETNRRYMNRRDDVGIWHETYLVNDGAYEAIYSGMPAFGLGKVAELVPATGSREAARQRLAS